MTDILVIRGEADKQGDDIIDPLLSTEAAAVERGRKELNDQAHRKTNVEVNILFRPNLRIGQIVEIHSDLQQDSYRGKIVSITHQILRDSLNTLLTIERPL